MNAILKHKIDDGLANFTFKSGVSIDALPASERSELKGYSKIVYLRKKAVLFEEGESPKGVYILLSGKIKSSRLNMDGSVQIFFIYAEGELFGHRSILSGEKHPATATALENCELMFIDKDHFMNVMASSTRLNKIFLQSVSHEFAVLVNRINVFAQRGIKERLALFLLLLNEKYKTPGQISYDAEIRVNRGDLASFTGTSLENLVRTLKTFREKNYIRTEGKSIFINDFETLYAMSGL